MNAATMTDAEIRQWIDVINHEVARETLRDYMRLRSTTLAGTGEIRAALAASMTSTTQPTPTTAGVTEAMVPVHEWLPTYGRLPFKELGRDVNDAIYAKRDDYDFGDRFPGHVILPTMNFNSLNRIVSKYAERLSTAPPGDGVPGMVLVPREPTPEILNAIVKECKAAWGVRSDDKLLPAKRAAEWREIAKPFYRAMLSASTAGEPKP